MKITESLLALLAFASAQMVIASPIPTGTDKREAEAAPADYGAYGEYGTYGTYNNYPPPPPAPTSYGSYASYGTYPRIADAAEPLAAE